MTQGDIPDVVVRRWAVGAVVAGVLLTGCVSQGAPTPTDGSTPATSAPSPTPTPSPTATVTAAVPPEPGADMSRTDEAGAVAAAEYFMALYAYLRESGDPAPWIAASDPNCVFCSNAVASRGTWDAGERIEDYPLVVDEVRWLTLDETLGIHGVQLHYSVATYAVRDGAGALVRTVPAEEGYLILDLGPTSNGWLLVEGESRSTPLELGTA